MVQRRVVPQLQTLIPLNPIRLPDRGEHLRLLHRVNPQIRLKIQLHIEQIRRITRLLRHDLKHTSLDRVTGGGHRGSRGNGAPGAGAAAGRRCRGRRRSGSGCGGRRHSCRRTRCAITHEPDNMIQRRVVPQLQTLIPLNPIGLPDRGKHLRLLHRVNPQIRLKIQLHIEQIRRITRLLRHDLKHTSLDRVTGGGHRGSRSDPESRCRLGGGGRPGQAPRRGPQPEPTRAAGRGRTRRRG